ncbi:hypothetical protein V6N11_039601 [Hibiscus sabdariffa]|uniref:Uncharacterized protein n=1 Tax=Hibiscus sabdariffa TaxID=183260 RepID=A0ABR2SPB3_9ROSI
MRTSSGRLRVLGRVMGHRWLWVVRLAVLCATVGGVCSEGDVDFALTRIRSREGLDIVQPSVFVAEHDSLGVKVESTEQYGRVVGVNGEGSPSTAVLGLAGLLRHQSSGPLTEV